MFETKYRYDGRVKDGQFIEIETMSPVSRGDTIFDGFSRYEVLQVQHHAYSRSGFTRLILEQVA
jgi:hypothetical protein